MKITGEVLKGEEQVVEILCHGSEDKTFDVGKHGVDATGKLTMSNSSIGDNVVFVSQALINIIRLMFTLPEDPTRGRSGKYCCSFQCGRPNSQ